jgi:signal transduction histidine kinase
MRDRVEQIGGALTVHAAADGATITANIPIDVEWRRVRS